MSAKMMRIVATVTALGAFAALAVAFVLKSAAYWQVLAGVVAVVAIEWQRHESRKSTPSADRKAAE